MSEEAPMEALAAAVRAVRARAELSKAERGRANPTHTQLDRLARGLGLRNVAELWREADRAR
jgi:transcriptional regulator with XRE-family HTH domain